jgi:hypothetical protein
MATPRLPRRNCPGGRPRRRRCLWIRTRRRNWTWPGRRAHRTGRANTGPHRRRDSQRRGSSARRGRQRGDDGCASGAWTGPARSIAGARQARRMRMGRLSCRQRDRGREPGHRNPRQHAHNHRSQPQHQRRDQEPDAGPGQGRATSRFVNEHRHTSRMLTHDRHPTTHCNITPIFHTNSAQRPNARDPADPRELQ